MNSETIAEYSQLAFEEMIKAFGDKWNTLAPVYRRSAKRAARRLVELEFEKRTTDKDVSADFAFVKTTVEGFKLAGEIALYDAFWKGVNKALEALGSFLVGVGKGLVPGLGSLFNGIDLGEFIND